MAILTTLSLAATSGHAAPAPRPEIAELGNGLRVLTIDQPHLPMVVVTVLVDAGTRFDPAGREGIASLTAELLTEGTETRTSAEIHDEIDFLGARLSAGASDDYVEVSLTILARDLAAGLEILADVIRRPTFAEDEFSRQRAEALAGIESEDQNPGAVAARAFRAEVFRDGPYRTPSSGTKESLAALGRDDVVAFHAAAYRPERTRIVFSGDVRPAETKPLVERLFGDWTVEAPALPPVESRLADSASVVRIDRNLSQANLVWGHRGTTRSDPDWYPLQVMNHILGGGGFSARLMKSIRSEAGLAYSVYSYFSGKKLPGSFQVVLQTKNESAGDALERLRKEIDRIRTELVSEEELSEAKRYLTGSFPLRFDSNSKLVGFYSQVDYYDIGFDYPDRYESLIDGVTREEILRVAKEYLHPEKAILVVVGKQSEIELD